MVPQTTSQTEQTTGPAGAPTARQRRILDFIARTIRERGYPPTVREIGEAVGLTSASSVHAQLANLERAGLLHRDPSKSRAIGLADGEADRPAASAGRATRSPAARGAATPAAGTAVPLLGRIAAGAPLLAAEHVEEMIQVPSGFADDDAEHFALRVSGDSMIGAGILDGDLVVVRRQDDAREGDIVAALLPGPAEDEATVKRLHREPGRVMLVPENPTMRPFEMHDGRVVGRVTGVLRRLRG